MLENVNPFDVLLLEDEPADANLVRIAFRKNKLSANLHHVMNGQEGLDFLLHQNTYQNTPRPDLILLDLNMPLMNGYQFLATLKKDKKFEEFSDIPIVILTTSNAERDIAASYQLSAAGYITKPLSMDQFIAIISQLSTYWLTLVRLPKKRFSS